MDIPVSATMSKICFLDHEETEAVHEDEMTNPTEADKVGSLVQHLLLHSYKASDICCTSTSVGQLKLIHRRLRFAGIGTKAWEQDARALRASGDGRRPTAPEGMTFWGPTSEAVQLMTIGKIRKDEVRILIVSTVQVRDLGDADVIPYQVDDPSAQVMAYLRDSGRIYTLLTRAKEGLFVLGNAKLLRKQSALWSQVLDGFEKQGAMYTKLPIELAADSVRGD